MQRPLASRMAHSLLSLTLVLATLSPAATLPSTLPHPPQPPNTLLDEVQDLVERVRRERHKVSVDVFKSLAKNKDKPGLQALENCIDLLGSKSDSDVGSRALRHAFKALGYYKGVQKLEPRVIRFLVKEIVDESFMRGLHARNTLVNYNPAAGAVIEKALLKAKNPMARARLLGALMPTLSQRGDAPSLKLIFEHAQLPFSFLASELREELASFKGEGLGRTLKDGLADQSVDLALRLAILKGLTPVSGDQIGEALESVLKSKNTSLVTAALDALHSRGEWGPANQLKRLAKSKDPQKSLRAMRNLASLPDSKGPAKWISKIAKELDSKDASERQAAMDVLQELATPFAVQALAASLEYKDPNTRGQALAALLSCRSKESVPAILQAYQNESDPRLQQQAHAVLCDLTGLDWGAAPARWRKWWDDTGANFVLPSKADSAIALKARKRAAWEKKERYAFFGLKIESDAAVFVVDASGSMAATNDSDVSRMDEAKRQLSSALKQLPDGARFNFLFFGTKVVAFAEDLVVMTPAVREKALKVIKEQRTLGATAMFDGLRTAFEHAEADTIYLLSDGSPSGGDVDDPEEIRKLVRQWNKGRKPRITIHSVTLGRSLALMGWLAEDSEGVHVDIPEH